MERRIYVNWAFSELADEKCKINREIYQEIKDKARFKLVKNGYGHKEYEVIDNPEGLTPLELALICDNGNLCFGYRTNGRNIIIHTD